MEKEATVIKVTTVSDFKIVLLSMDLPKNKEQELVFSSSMIDSLCKSGKCYTYKFAHNLENDCYMRMKIGDITLEYIVIGNEKTPEYDSYVYKISQKGRTIYGRPINAVKAIHMILSDTHE